MSMKEIFQAYQEGQRQGVVGPLSYAEAFALATIAQKAVNALKDVVSRYPDLSVKADRARHYNACAAAAEAEAFLGGLSEETGGRVVMNALNMAERFIAGFEDDPMQENVEQMLAAIRDARTKLRTTA